MQESGGGRKVRLREGKRRGGGTSKPNLQKYTFKRA